jgi:hypothetical protein
MLRILFICSSLEPGRDGVGDYTRCLACELSKQGHLVRCLALNDPGILAPTEDIQEFDGARLTVLRLPRSERWDARARRARWWIDRFDPTWISLQFVCFGFHPRGLCWPVAGRLRAIVGERPVQIMFHELWIGAEEKARWKDRLIGGIQRACAMRLYSRLNIRCTLTSNPAYAATLQGLGLAAKILPLFGSLPLPRTPAVSRRPALWSFLMFGALHPSWSPEPLFAHLRALGETVEIVHAGHIGHDGGRWARLTDEYAGIFRFRQLGPLPPPGLMQAFGEADFGIATTPWEIIGKSGSAAAMLEHGLPVVVNRDDVHYEGWREEGYDSQLIKMGSDLPQRLRLAGRRQPQSRLEPTALRFLDELGRAGK